MEKCAAWATDRLLRMAREALWEGYIWEEKLSSNYFDRCELRAYDYFYAATVFSIEVGINLGDWMTWKTQTMDSFERVEEVAT